MTQLGDPLLPQGSLDGKEGRQDGRMACRCQPQSPRSPEEDPSLRPEAKLPSCPGPWPVHCQPQSKAPDQQLHQQKLISSQPWGRDGQGQGEDWAAPPEASVLGGRRPPLLCVLRSFPWACLCPHLLDENVSRVGSGPPLFCLRPLCQALCASTALWGGLRAPTSDLGGHRSAHTPGSKLLGEQEEEATSQRPGAHQPGRCEAEAGPGSLLEGFPGGVRLAEPWRVSWGQLAGGVEGAQERVPPQLHGAGRLRTGWPSGSEQAHPAPPNPARLKAGRWGPQGISLSEMKSDGERKIPFGFTSKWNIKNKIKK